MITEQVNKSLQSKLFLDLVKYSDSINSRSVSCIVHAHSENSASLTLIITGRRGSINKDVILFFNEISEEWQAASEGTKYSLANLSEITSILKQKVSSLSSLVSKI